MPVLFALAAIGLAYPVSVGAVVAYETYSDYTCYVLYEEVGPEEQSFHRRGPYPEYLPNPGYACNYLVDGEWITLREDLARAMHFALGTTIAAASVAATGLVIYFLRHRTTDFHSS